MSDEWRQLTPSRDYKGYFLARFKEGRKATQIKLHRLVLEAFVGPRPPGTECRHLDGDRTNNRLENLVWGTPSENTRDKRQHAETFPHKGWKLTEPRAIEIRSLRASGVSVSEITVRFGISASTAYRVLSEEAWKLSSLP